MIDEDFFSQARCLGLDPKIFFPERRGGLDPRAKTICAQCPVREECLDYAIELNIQHGVWGGCSERERRRLRRSRRRALAEA